MNSATLEIPSATAPLGRALAGKYLIFSLGSISCGISLLFTQEILQIPQVASLPHVPDYVRGVINLRGMILPVIDLSLRLRLSYGVSEEQASVIVVRVNPSGGHSTHVGLMVDDVEDIVELKGDEIEQASGFGSLFPSDCILGMAKIRGRVKPLLDLDAILFADPLESGSTFASY